MIRATITIGASRPADASAWDLIALGWDHHGGNRRDHLVEHDVLVSVDATEVRGVILLQAAPVAGWAAAGTLYGRTVGAPHDQREWIRGDLRAWLARLTAASARKVCSMLTQGSDDGFEVYVEERSRSASSPSPTPRRPQLRELRVRRVAGPR